MDDADVAAEGAVRARSELVRLTRGKGRQAEIGAGTVDDAIPVEGGAGVGLVRLNMVVAQDAAVGFQRFVGEFLRDEFSGGIARIVAVDFGEHLAERGGELGEGGVLLRGEIVLDEVGVLDGAAHGRGAGRMADKVFRVDHRVFDGGRNRNGGPTGGIGLIPSVEHLHVAGRVGPHVGDFDADGAGVGRRGVEGALLEIEGLVNRAVDIQHEMDAETAVIVEDVEAGLADTADVVVHDELIDDVAQGGQIPATAANAFEVRRRERGIAAEAVARGRLEVFGDLFGFFKTAVVERSEPALGAVGIVALRIEPCDHTRAGVEELAGDDDFVAGAGDRSAGAVEATRGEEEGEGSKEKAAEGRRRGGERETGRGGEGEKGNVEARHRGMSEEAAWGTGGRGLNGERAGGSEVLGVCRGKQAFGKKDEWFLQRSGDGRFDCRADDGAVVGRAAETKNAVLLGNEVLAAEGFKVLAGKRVELITNPSGMNRKLDTPLAVLRAAPGVSVWRCSWSRL